MPERAPVPIFVPLLVIVVGLSFVLIGAAKPGFVWDMGKVKAGREAIGDGALGAVFIVFGAVFATVGAVLLKRRG